MHPISLQQVQKQHQLEEQQVALFDGVSFRTSRPAGGESELPPAASAFPSPAERDLKAIEGFFAHVNAALPVSAWSLMLAGFCK
jgi:hypothetical protein